MMTISDIAGRQTFTAMGSMWACQSSLYMATMTTPPAQTTCLQSMSCRPASLSTTLERRCCSGTTTYEAWQQFLCAIKTDADEHGLSQGQDIRNPLESCAAAYSSIGMISWAEIRRALSSEPEQHGSCIGACDRCPVCKRLSIGSTKGTPEFQPLLTKGSTKIVLHSSDRLWW